MANQLLKPLERWPLRSGSRRDTGRSERTAAGRQMGVIQLARASELSIIPWRSAVQEKLFASWDRFMVPYP